MIYLKEWLEKLNITDEDIMKIFDKWESEGYIKEAIRENAKDGL